MLDNPLNVDYLFFGADSTDKAFFLSVKILKDADKFETNSLTLKSSLHDKEIQHKCLQTGIPTILELKIIMASFSSDEKIQNHLIGENIQWIFNSLAVPPFGSLWEAGVKQWCEQ
ncbi:hypothetical protein CEXT_336201 [Caerostris extrusa]|uniref:Uncharacterized protein n=1 Tax=Caerostris extrusa TaxID=172846 RepID=A0AAV4Q2G1_CAEEX|nr:hypothetical protein CEXT_336201 [Caerostris extrusa]